MAFMINSIDYKRKAKMKGKDLGLSSWTSIVIDRYIWKMAKRVSSRGRK